MQSFILPSKQIGLCLLVALPAHVVNALEPLRDSGGFNQAAAYLQFYNTDLNFSGDKRKTAFHSLEFSLHEKVSERIDGSLQSGILFTDQVSNPISAGQDTSGGYLGLEIRGVLITAEHYSMRLGTHYRYAITSQSIGNQDVQWEWHELGLTLSNQIDFTPKLFSHFNIEATLIDGDEKTSGDVNSLTDFKQSHSLSGALGLGFQLENNGQIGFAALFGAKTGARFIFRKYF